MLWRRNAAKDRDKWILHLTYEFCKAVWIYYWTRLLGYLTGKIAATRRKSIKLDLLLLPIPEEAEKKKSMLIIPPNRSPYLQTAWHWNYNLNSLENVFSGTVTTAIFKLSFTRHTMVPVKPNTLSGKLSVKDSKWHFNREKSVWNQSTGQQIKWKKNQNHLIFFFSVTLTGSTYRRHDVFSPSSHFVDWLLQTLIERRGFHNFKRNRLSRWGSFVKIDYWVLISHLLYQLHSTRPPAH